MATKEKGTLLVLACIRPGYDGPLTFGLLNWWSDLLLGGIKGRQMSARMPPAIQDVRADDCSMAASASFQKFRNVLNNKFFKSDQNKTI